MTAIHYRPEQVITAIAFGCCVPREFTGCVHSVFRRACNVVTREGVVLTLLGHELGNLPHGIGCALAEEYSFEQALRVGFEVGATAGVLSIPQASLIVDFAAAPRWNGAVTAYPVDVSSERTLQKLIALRELLRQQSARAGLAAILRGTAAGDPIHAAMLRRLSVSLPLLAPSSAASDAVVAEQALSQLVGMGVGLTPSGDDFIVGYLAALWSRSEREAAVHRLLPRLSQSLRALSNKTHLLSRQFLLDATAGQFSQPLVDLLRVLADADGEGIEVAAARAIRTGHSSGADATLGLLFGLDADLVLEPMRAIAHVSHRPPGERFAAVSA